MDLPDSRPIEPSFRGQVDAEAAGQRQLRVWLGKAAVAYALYAALCFTVESVARARFAVVPEKAPITASTSHGAAMERAKRLEARSAMEQWAPYTFYTTSVAVLAVAAFVGFGALLLRGTWSSLLKVPVARAKLGAAGFMVAGFVGVLLVFLPQVLSMWVYELAPT